MNLEKSPAASQMLLSKPLAWGDLRGTIYDFTKAGDILPKHVHDENDVHIAIVGKGRIRAYSHDWSAEYEGGQIIDFRPGEPHELMALEGGTRIVNIIKKMERTQ